MNVPVPLWLTRVTASDLAGVPCLCFALQPGVEGILPQKDCMGSNGVIVLQNDTGRRPRRVVLHRQNLSADGAWHCRKLLKDEGTRQDATTFAAFITAIQLVEPGVKWHEWATLFDEFGHFGDYSREEKSTFISGLERYAEDREIRAVLNIFDPPDTLEARGRVAMGPSALARHQCALKPDVFCRGQEWFVRWRLVGDLVLMYGNDGAQTICSVDDDDKSGDEVQRKRRECGNMVGIAVETKPQSPGFVLRMDEHLFLSLGARRRMWHQKRELAKQVLVEDAEREDNSVYRKFFVQTLKLAATSPEEFQHAMQLYNAGDKSACATAEASADAAFKKYVDDGRQDLGPLDRLVHSICDASKLKRSVEHRALLGTLHANDIPACQGMSKTKPLDHTYDTRKRIFCTRTHLEKEGFSSLERTLYELLESFYGTKKGDPWPERKKQVLAPMKTLYRAPSCSECPFGYADPGQCLVGEADFTRFYTPADVIIENAQARKFAETEDDDDAETDAIMSKMSLDC